MLIDKKRLQTSDRAKAKTIQIGPEPHQAALVVDDFFEDPHYVRSLALSLDYHDVRGTYPGYEARLSLNTDEILSRCRRLADPELAMVARYRNHFLFSLMDERVDPKLRHYPHPHVDNVGEGVACLAGMVYLNLPEQCRGGTGFYRHRETGIIEDRGEISAGLADYMVKHGLSTVREAINHIIHVSPEQEAAMMSAPEEWGYLCESNAEWELLEMVEMRFNRLVIFDSYLFHHPYVMSGHFGHSQETRRLTQTFFLEMAGSPAPG
ncbi:MAG: DUF6445 family protein [Myxococcota bacterium]